MPLPKYFPIAFCLLCTCLLCNSAVADAPKPHVVMLVAEREYQTDETLPAFAKQHLDDYRSTFVFADPTDANHLIGIDAVKTADVLVVSVRRRTLTKDQLDIVRAFSGRWIALSGLAVVKRHVGFVHRPGRRSTTRAGCLDVSASRRWQIVLHIPGTCR